MSADRPKEFGGPSAEALANMRALEKIDMPFAQSITPGAKSFKRNGFHETYVDAPDPQITDRYILVGQDNTTAFGGYVVYQGGSTTQSFRSSRLRFATTDDLVYPGAFGGVVNVGPHGALLLGTQYGNNVGYGVSMGFRTPTAETTFYAPSGPVLYSPPNISRVVRGMVYGTAVEQHNPGTYSVYLPGTGTGRVVPGACRRLDNPAAAVAGFRWVNSAMPIFPGPYNYHTSPLIVLRPDTFVFVASAIVGGYTGVSAPTGEFPAAGAATPLPLFLFSTDGGDTYFDIDLSYMLAGGDNAWKMPGDVTLASAAGRNFHMTWLRNAFFVSLVTAINTGVSTAVLEHRLFVGQNLAALTRVSSPPNFGTVWESPGRMLIDPSHSRIAFCLTNINSASPDQFSKSLDEGATWTVEPLPWPSHMCGFPRQVRDGVLEIMVAEGPEFGDVLNDITMWRSTDFGTSWKRISVAIRNMRKTVSTQYSGAFLDMKTYLTLGSFPREGVETYRYDNRIPVPAFVPI